MQFDGKRFNYTEFAKAIAEKKQQDEESLASLREKSGISTATWSRLMSGEQGDSSVEMILAICEWLGTPITKFTI